MGTFICLSRPRGADISAANIAPVTVQSKIELTVTPAAVCDTRIIVSQTVGTPYSPYSPPYLSLQNLFQSIDPAVLNKLKSPKLASGAHFISGSQVRLAPKVPLNSSLQQYKNTTFLKAFYTGSRKHTTVQQSALHRGHQLHHNGSLVQNIAISRPVLHVLT
jgi:hypothetical protein